MVVVDRGLRSISIVQFLKPTHTRHPLSNTIGQPFLAAAAAAAPDGDSNPQLVEARRLFLAHVLNAAEEAEAAAAGAAGVSGRGGGGQSGALPGGV